MNNLSDSKKDLKDIQRLVRPSLWTGIILSLICLGPYGHLILKILTEDSNLLLTALLVFPTLILLSMYWCWHIYTLRIYKQTAKEIYNQFKKN